MFRRILLASALIAGCFAAGAVASGGAQAMTISTPAGLAKAVGEGNIDKVVYVCRRVGTRWGGWRRSCWWRPGYGYRSYGYRYGGWGYPYRPYGYGWRYRYGYRW